MVTQPPDFNPITADCTFCIGANDNAVAVIAPRLVQLTREAGFSGIRFAFRALDPDLSPSQLENGEIDVALTSRNAVSGAPQESLLEETFHMAQRKGHPRGTGLLTLGARDCIKSGRRILWIH